jgi:virulence-associated protein VapD
MSINISSENILALSRAYHDLSTGLGNYRFDNWKTLSDDERKDLEDKQWTLFNLSSDLNAQSALLALRATREDIETLQKCTKGMKKAAQTIEDIKDAITIASKAIALGGAFYLAMSTGQLSVAVIAANELIAQMSN